MACDKKEGIKNILLTFTDCDTEETTGPISHKQPVDADLPTVMACSYANTDIGRGRVTVAEQSQNLSVTVQGDRSIPMSWYQGCAEIKIQIEWFTGEVWTGMAGQVIDAEASNRTSITMSIIFEEIDIMLPASGEAAINPANIPAIAA